MLVVADGTFLIYNDRALDQVSYLPLGSTPAGILLADRISIDDPALTITDFTDDGTRLRLTLVRTDSPGEGTLTIVFDKAPLALVEWEVTDTRKSPPKSPSPTLSSACHWTAASSDFTIRDCRRKGSSPASVP